MALVVLLDNGHGAETLGKRSPDGRLREYRWARNAAARIAELLAAEGVQCKRIVPEEWDVPLGERITRADREVQQAQARGDSAVLISLHCNAAHVDGGWGLAEGWQVHVSKRRNTFDKRLAIALAEAMAAAGVQVRQPLPGQQYWESNFFILRNAICPAALTENLFMDSRADCERLLSAEWLERLAKAHVAGLRKYAQNF